MAHTALNEENAKNMDLITLQYSTFSFDRGELRRISLDVEDMRRKWNDLQKKIVRISIMRNATTSELRDNLYLSDIYEYLFEDCIGLFKLWLQAVVSECNLYLLPETQKRMEHWWREEYGEYNEIPQGRWCIYRIDIAELEFEFKYITWDGDDLINVNTRLLEDILIDVENLKTFYDKERDKNKNNDDTYCPK